MSNVDDLRRALQDFLAPELKEIKGELKAINVRMDSFDRRFDDLIKILELDRRVERLEREREAKTQ
jgi:hypothetical protein